VGQVHRLYVEKMLAAFSALNTRVYARPAEHGRDFNPRATTRILFSYHSVGNDPAIWRVKEGYLPYIFTIDRSGYSGWLARVKDLEFERKVSAIPPQIALERLDRLRLDIVEKRSSKYPQPPPEKFDLEDFVFLPMQMPNDTVIRLSRLDYISAVQFLIDTSRLKRRHLVIKRHPLCEDGRVTELLQKASLSPYVHVVVGPIHQYISSARVVVCCNSGVGFESLLFGKPVFSFGQSDYELAIRKVGSFPELESVFDEIDAPIEADVAKFVSAYLDECCMDIRDFKQVLSKVGEALVLSLQTRADN
jgi:hypothetical protein